MTEINYIVYCHQCHMIVGDGVDQLDAGRKAVDHIMSSPHMFVSVYNRREAEEKGIAWPKE